MIASGTRKCPFFDPHLPYRRRRRLKRAYAAAVYHLRVLGKLQMQKMCHAVLRS